MRMKQIEASTLKEALAQAHRELGPSAVLLATQEVPPLSKLGLGRPRVRITVSIDEPADRFGKPYLDTSLHRAAERLDRALQHPESPAEEARHQVARQALRAPQALKGAQLRELLSRLHVLPPPWRKDGPRVVLVVGASGVGKTVTSAKLAAHARHFHRCSSGLISADAVRIAGHDQLSSYARILNIPFSAVETSAELERALHQLRSCRLIIVDTAGCNPMVASELGEAVQLQNALRSRAQVETHLVISATQGSDDQLACCDAFVQARAVDALLFTKIDETRQPAQVVHTAVRSGLPVSLLSASSQVLGRLQAAQPEFLARLSMHDAA
ncbi:MAG: hypothetical protein ABIJ09_18150 [Pseudomonadota bacterium]